MITFWIIRLYLYNLISTDDCWGRVTFGEIHTYTEEVTLSGKKTPTGRTSGETIMAPKGINLSGKRTELRNYMQHIF